MLRRLLSCLAALMLIALPSASPAQRAKDWTTTVTLGANGAFILGNPAARTKLVEYFSYTCPHCAHFAEEATTPLKAGWIKNGTVSIEYRNFVRDAFDLTAAMLSRCGGATKFLGNHEALYGNYEGWMKRASSYADDGVKRDQAARIADIADKTGLNALLAKRGLTIAAQRACLADKKTMETVLALTSGAQEADPNFEGTPGFLIDGKPVPGVHDWTRLKPLLPAPAAPLPVYNN